MKHSITLILAGISLFSCNNDDFNADATKRNAAQPNAEGNLHTRVLNDNLNYPWEIIWGSDNFIWFTEREGRVKRMNPETGETILVANISEVASTTTFNGLLGMALHPQFDSNPYVYLVYNYFATNGDYLQKIVRYTYDGTTLNSPMILVDGILGKVGGDFIHNGSRL